MSTSLALIVTALDVKSVVFHSDEQLESALAAKHW